MQIDQRQLRVSALIAAILVVGVLVVVLTGRALDDTADAAKPIPTTTTSGPKPTVDGSIDSTGENSRDSGGSHDVDSSDDAVALPVAIVRLLDGRLEWVEPGGKAVELAAGLDGVGQLVALQDGSVIYTHADGVWHAAAPNEPEQLLSDATLQLDDVGWVAVQTWSAAHAEQGFTQEQEEIEARRWLLDLQSAGFSEIEPTVLVYEQHYFEYDLRMASGAVATVSDGIDGVEDVVVRRDGAVLASPTDGRFGPVRPYSALLCPGAPEWLGPQSIAHLQVAPDGTQLVWVHHETTSDGNTVQVRALDVFDGSSGAVSVPTDASWFSSLSHFGSTALLLREGDAPSYLVDLATNEVTVVGPLGDRVWVVPPEEVGPTVMPHDPPAVTATCTTGGLTIYGLGEVEVGDPLPLIPECPERLWCTPDWVAHTAPGGDTVVAFSVTSEVFTTPSGLHVGMRTEDVVGALGDRLTIDGVPNMVDGVQEGWLDIRSLDFRPRSENEQHLALRFMICAGYVREIRTGLADYLWDDYPGAFTCP